MCLCFSTDRVACAQKIVINLKDSELLATGDVSILQSSSTLSAEIVSYSYSDRKITAHGGKPKFAIRQTEHHTVISADKITAFTEKQDIHFTDNVQGVVYLKEEEKP